MTACSAPPPPETMLELVRLYHLRADHRLRLGHLLDGLQLTVAAEDWPDFVANHIVAHDLAIGQADAAAMIEEYRASGTPPVSAASVEALGQPRYSIATTIPTVLAGSTPGRVPQPQPHGEWHLGPAQPDLATAVQMAGLMLRVAAEHRQFPAVQLVALPAVSSGRG